MVKLSCEENVSLLSDDELFQQLKQYGVDVGPIVGSTRRVYERKLEMLLNGGESQQSGGESSPNSPSPLHLSDSEEETGMLNSHSFVADEPMPMTDSPPPPTFAPQPSARRESPARLTSIRPPPQPWIAPTPSPVPPQAQARAWTTPNFQDTPYPKVSTWNSPSALNTSQSSPWHSPSSPEDYVVRSRSSINHNVSRVSELPSNYPGYNRDLSSQGSGYGDAAKSTSSKMVEIPDKKSSLKSSVIKMIMVAVFFALVFLIYQSMESDTSNPVPNIES